MYFYINTTRCGHCRGTASGIIDGVSQQWGLCSTCRVRWPIIPRRYALNPYETFKDRENHDLTIAKFRIIKPLEEIVWLYWIPCPTRGAVRLY